MRLNSFGPMLAHIQLANTGRIWKEGSFQKNQGSLGQWSEQFPARECVMRVVSAWNHRANFVTRA
jgi:hypothetical protein